MTFIARNVRNSLTGGILAAASILAAGCGSHGSGAAGQASSQVSTAHSSVAAASAPAGVASSTPVGIAASQASSPAQATHSSAAAASVPSCLTSNLRITLGDGGAAAGTDFTVLDFTNSGGASCTLYGFPGVSLINSSGAQIGAAATRNPAKASTLITLAPGAEASATLGVANAENYPATACRPTSAAQLKVFPPNQTRAIELRFTATGCAVSSTRQLNVTAVTAGAGQTIKG
jgi:hypothetical protein